MIAVSKVKLAVVKSTKNVFKKITKRNECNCSSSEKYIRRIQRSRIQKLARVTSFYQCKTCLGSIVVKVA